MRSNGGNSKGIEKSKQLCIDTLREMKNENEEQTDVQKSIQTLQPRAKWLLYLCVCSCNGD